MKLNRYGMRGETNEWIRSHLSDRQQVVVNETKSNIQSVKTGIAKGSIAGLILFIIYGMIYR